MPVPVHGLPTPGTSSIAPSQSSSMPSQISVVLAIEPTQVLVPAWHMPGCLHCHVPRLQRLPLPVLSQSPRLPVEQQSVPTQASCGLSSMQELQSLSRPSQNSVDGAIRPWQAP